MKHRRSTIKPATTRSRFLRRIPQLLASSLFCTSLQAADLAKWDFTGENSPATSTADVINANLTSSGVLTRGSGASTSTASNSFRTQGFSNNGISVTNTDYFQTTIAAAPGYNLSLTAIDAYLAGTANFSNSPGTTNQFAYSLDGTSFTLIGSPQTRIGNGALATIDSSSITALQNVPSGTTITLRFYASGQTTTGGWGFNSASSGSYGLALTGTVLPSAATLTLSASPTSFSENGGTSTGTVTRIGGDNTSALTVTLASNDTGEATVPATVEIPANAPSATFAITGVDDSILDGAQTVSLTATAASYADGGTSVTVNDDEVPPSLTLSPSPSSIPENGGTSTITITRAGGNNTAAIVLDLTSSDITEAIVPSTVTIPANEASTTFVVTAQDDSIFDGAQTVTITATDAGTFYPNGTTNLSVTDDDVSPVIISQYYEGTGNDKYIELFNTTASAVTLTGYRITNWTNAIRENWKTATGSPTNSLALDSITIPANSYWLLKGAGAAAPSYANTNSNTTDNTVISGFNGDDSVVLYFGATNAIANIVDAISFTAADGADKSFYRIANTQGYSLTAGQSILNATSVWASKTLAEVASATPADAWYLNYYTAPQAPTLETFALGANAANSASAGVTIAYTSTGGTPLEYRISETADLSDATWTAIGSFNSYQLSNGNGTKTVYFQLRNATGESAIVSDTIDRVSFTYAPQIIISQYYDPDAAGANSKYIELTNISTNPVDLTGYALVRWTNQDAENWKYTGSSTASPSAVISLSTLGTLTAGQTVLVAHSSATTPIAAASAQLTNANLAHTGNDSIGLYSGTPSPETLVDVISFTNTGNEGADKSFVRQNNDQGFSFSSGSNVTNFSTIWVEASIASVASAGFTANEKLGVYPGGGTTPFTTWATGAPYNLTGNDALFDADPDKDGMSNGIEFIVGGNPTVPNDANAYGPQVTISEQAGNRVATIVYRRTDVSEYLNPQLQLSNNLIDWEFATSLNATISVEDNAYGAGVDKFTVVLDANGAKGFVRLFAQSTP